MFDLMNLRKIGLPKIGLFVLALGLCSSAATAATRGYIVNDFNVVRLDAPIDVAIATGRSTTARGQGEQAMLDRVELSVTGDVLTIRLRPSAFQTADDPDQSSPVKLILTTPALSGIELAGAGSIVARGMTQAHAQITAVGSGLVQVGDLAVDRLDVAQIGSGSVRLAGKANELTARLSGAGALDASGLDVRDLDVTLQGAASVQASASRTAKIDAIGSGSVKVAGHPGCTVHHVGSGVVSCGSKTY